MTWLVIMEYLVTNDQIYVLFVDVVLLSTEYDLPSDYKYK